jgi:hypothetical protein
MSMAEFPGFDLPPFCANVPWFSGYNCNAINRMSTEQLAPTTTEPVDRRSSQQARRRAISFRWLGIWPLGFFLGHAIHYWREGGFGNMLFMCNAGNLLLAIGLFSGEKRMTRAAAIWTIPGLALWILFVLFVYPLVWASVFVHLGGIIVALLALRWVRVDRLAWLYAFIWYLVLQLAARLTTAPELNVNVAWRIQPGWEGAFSSYWKFWLVMSLLVAASLWVINLALLRIWPEGDRSSTSLKAKSLIPPTF